jgi:FkbH-like protein
VYETEANSLLESPEQIPAEVLRSFASLKGQIASRTVLPWSEHCTECVWPTCYASCELYSARPDGGCRRFSDGMVRIDCPGAVNAYLLKIRFKRWGKLWTPGNIRLHSAEHAARLERNDYRIGSTLQRLPLPSLVKITATTKRYGFKKRRATAAMNGDKFPTCFLLECYNPESHKVQLSLTMRAMGEAARMPFQKLIPLRPGFQRVRIPLEEITGLLDLTQTFGIDLIPNNEDHETDPETTLYFGLMDFVTELPAKKSTETNKSDPATKKIKCIVWDLDNTLWDGVLVEDGPDRLRLKSGISEIIGELDQRGILHSIASKNNFEDALPVLKKFQLDHYFLCPQISWQPKSQSLQAIARQLNIGLDSILFIDDSAFELGEVVAACPEVRVLNAEDYLGLCSREEFKVPVTDESRQRRELYQIEAARQSVAQSFDNNYMEFLRHCQIRLAVRPMSEENLERVHELTTRTNQMNFSGNRYDRSVLRQILSNPDLDTFVLSCEDRFGSYGVIGFSIVNRREPRMTDLMFSCRIQSKRVEHAFLTWLIRKYIADTNRDFHADYRKTSRNAASGQVFADLGLEEIEEHDGVLSLTFAKTKTAPDDGVIDVAVQEGMVATTV